MILYFLSIYRFHFLFLANFSVFGFIKISVSSIEHYFGLFDHELFLHLLCKGTPSARAVQIHKEQMNLTDIPLN